MAFGNCWNCGKLKENINGLCPHCGRFDISVDTSTGKRTLEEIDTIHESLQNQKPILGGKIFQNMPNKRIQEMSEAYVDEYGADTDWDELADPFGF